MLHKKKERIGTWLMNKVKTHFYPRMRPRWMPIIVGKEVGVLFENFDNFFFIARVLKRFFFSWVPLVYNWKRKHTHKMYILVSYLRPRLDWQKHQLQQKKKKKKCKSISHSWGKRAQSTLAFFYEEIFFFFLLLHQEDPWDKVVRGDLINR